MARKRDSNTQDRLKDAFEKLRAENRRLKKQISQLQKQNSKLHNFDTDVWNEFEEEIEEVAEIQKPSEEKCPKCKHPIKKIEVHIFTIKVCEECGWKKRKPLT